MATEPGRAPMEAAQSRDLLTAKVDALVVPVNLRGVPGAGFAKLAAELYADWADDYKRACKDGRLGVGELASFDRGSSAQPRYIVSLPTKRDWRDGSILADVLAGIDALPAELERLGARSVAVPGLGTGLGGLQTDDVFPHFERAFAESDIRVMHAFGGAEQALERDLFGQVIEERSLFDREAKRPPLPARGQWHDNWFSNMKPFEKPLVEDGISYKTPEHYYQAAKVANRDQKAELAAMPPHKAKRAVREMVGEEKALDFAALEEAMGRALHHKFAPGTRAFDMLMSTDRDEIVEWNNWGDRKWGRDIATGAGENRLGMMLMRLREEYRELGLEFTPRDVPGEQLEQDRPAYAAIGSRSLPRNHPLALLAEGTAARLERLGYVQYSGGADGADRAFERGVEKSTNKIVFRPGYDSSKQLPPGYLVVDGAKVREARAIAMAVTSEFTKLDEFGQDLHTRNAFQVLGPELNKPVEFVLAIPKKEAPERVRGTRATMAIAEANGVEVIDLSDREQRSQFLERLAQMEQERGLDPMRIMSPAHGSLRAHLPIEGIDPYRSVTIAVRDVRDIERAGARGSEVYVGRTVDVPERLGIEARHDLGNPFIVGRDGMRGACAEMYADLLGDKLERDKATQTAIAELATKAVENGRLDLACHCAPSPCHGDAIAVAVAEGLKMQGVDVRTSLSPERYRDVFPLPATERRALDAVQQMGLESSMAAGPWRKIDGEVIAADEREAFVHIGEGKLRLIDQQRLPDGPLQEREQVSLFQGADGLKRLERAPRERDQALQRA